MPPSNGSAFCALFFDSFLFDWSMTFPRIGDLWNTDNSLFARSLVEIAPHFQSVAVRPERQYSPGRPGNFVAAFDSGIFVPWVHSLVMMPRREHTFG